MSYGVRWIKKILDKIIRKGNLFVMNNNLKENLIITEENLNTFLGKGKNSDCNFKKLVKAPPLPGNILVVDLKGYLVKMFFMSRTYSNLKITDNTPHQNILKDITVTGKLEGPVKEALKISVQLARSKLQSLLSEDELKKLTFNDYNLHFTYPYESKKGNAYGLSFYIAILSSVLDIPLPKSDYLVIGEVTPFGKVLTVKGLKSIVNICEFYEIKNLILPEGNTDI